MAAVQWCASLVREDVILRSETMGQPGFFDAEKRLAALSKKGDPLEAIAALVPWESFRADIEAVALTPDAERKSRAGRKPFDAILMFRMLILQSLYNLSDEQIEYQVRDRMSFTRFLALEFEDDIPDGTTLWVPHLQQTARKRQGRIIHSQLAADRRRYQNGIRCADLVSGLLDRKFGRLAPYSPC
jgi:hypothetical protein